MAEQNEDRDDQKDNWTSGRSYGFGQSSSGKSMGVTVTTGKSVTVSCTVLDPHGDTAMEILRQMLDEDEGFTDGAGI